MTAAAKLPWPSFSRTARPPTSIDTTRSFAPSPFRSAWSTNNAVERRHRERDRTRVARRRARRQRDGRLGVGRVVLVDRIDFAWPSRTRCCARRRRPSPVTLSVIVADALTASAPSAHVTVRFCTVQLPWDATADASVTPTRQRVGDDDAGRGGRAVVVRPAANSVNGVPNATGSADSVIVEDRSADGGCRGHRHARRELGGVVGRARRRRGHDRAGRGSEQRERRVAVRVGRHRRAAEERLAFTVARCVAGGVAVVVDGERSVRRAVEACPARRRAPPPAPGSSGRCSHPHRRRPRRSPRLRKDRD